MSNHTPGPWYVSTTDGVHYVRAESIPQEGRSKHAALAKTCGPFRGGKAEANARLLAAAPELLDIVRHIAGWDLEWLIRDKARDLLARIEGET